MIEVLKEAIQARPPYTGCYLEQVGFYLIEEKEIKDAPEIKITN